MVWAEGTGAGEDGVKAADVTPGPLCSQPPQLLGAPERGYFSSQPSREPRPLGSCCPHAGQKADGEVPAEALADPRLTQPMWKQSRM